MKKILIGALALLFMQNSDGMNLNPTVNNSSSNIINITKEYKQQLTHDLDILIYWMQAVDHLAISTGEIWNSEDNVQLKTHCERIYESFLPLFTFRDKSSFISDEAFQHYANLFLYSTEVGNNFYDKYRHTLYSAISENWLKPEVCNSIREKINNLLVLFEEGALIFFELNLMNKIFPERSNSNLSDFLNQKGCPVSKIRIIDFENIHYPSENQEIPDDLKRGLINNFEGSYPIQSIPNDLVFEEMSTEGAEYMFNTKTYNIQYPSIHPTNVFLAGIKDGKLITFKSDNPFCCKYHELNHAVANPLIIFFVIHDYFTSEITNESLDIWSKLIVVSSSPVAH